jgi:hypothetical protein
VINPKENQTIGRLGCGTLAGILHIAVGCSSTLSLDLGNS